MIHPKREEDDNRYLDETFGKMDELYEESVNATTDAVEHPAYYQVEPFVCREVLDIIEAFRLDFNAGNVLKYTLRAGLKADEEREVELRKALFYAGRSLGLNHVGTIRVELDNADAIRESVRFFESLLEDDLLNEVVADTIRSILDQL